MPPEWAPENRLEELVRSYGRVSPETDAEFYRELLKADVVTLGKASDPTKVTEGYHNLTEKTPFRIQLLAYKGEPVVAIFSSMKRMTDVIPQEYYGGTGFMQLKGEALLKMMMASDPKSKFALNPGHMVVKEFSAEEVNALLSGSIFKELEQASKARNIPRPVQVPKGAEVFIGRPKEAPTTLMSRLAEYFRSSGNVEEAWVGQIHIPSSGQPAHLFVCLKVSSKSQRNFDQVSIDIGPTIRSVLGEKELLDVLDASGQPKNLLDKLIHFFPK